MNGNSKIEIQRLSDKAYDVIKKRIIAFLYKPGEQLLEKDLVKELGISKSPIRDAFNRLERENLVTIIPFRGCYVSKISIEELKEIYQVREALEEYCLHIGLGSYTEEDIKDFEKVSELSKDKLDQGDEFEAYKAHYQFHFLIIKKSRNKLMENIFLNITDKLDRYHIIGINYIPFRLRISNEEHLDLLKAIKRRDLPVAIHNLKAHLSKVLEDYVNSEEIRKLGELNLNQKVSNS
jgi:DNA-binding GntR family transcriptional regulator